MLPPDTRAEHRPELFEIQNFYRPQDVYERLTRDHRSDVVVLDSNWMEIVEDELDPIKDIYVGIGGMNLRHMLKLANIDDVAKRTDVSSQELRDYFKKRFDRTQKMFVQEAFLIPSAELGDRLINSEQGLVSLQQSFAKQGLDVQRIQINEGMNDTFETALEVKLGNHLMGVKFDAQEPGANAYMIYYVTNLQSLGRLTKEEFIDEYKNFFVFFEKSLEAIYEAAGEDLPPVKLIFKPNPTEASTENPFDISCEYCTGSYKSSFDACTHCGAPSPAVNPDEI